MAKVSFSKTATAAPAAPTAPAIDVPATVTPVAPTAPSAPVAPTVEAPAPVAPTVEAPAPVAPTVEAPATDIPTSAVTVAGTAPSVPAVQGVSAIFDDNDISLRDIFLPRINLVHNVGNLCTIFNPGEIVLNQELVIHTPAQEAKKIAGNPPLNIVVVGFKKKQFAEKIKGGEQGMFVGTEAEVVAANGTTNYQEWQQSLSSPNPAAHKRYFEEYRTALIVIEKPAHVTDDTQFIYECEGKFYAVALWGMKGTAFTHAAKHFFTARTIGALKKTGYPGRTWTLTTELKQFKTNVTWVPVVRMTTENSPAFVEFCNGILGRS